MFVRAIWTSRVCSDPLRYPQHCRNDAFSGICRGTFYLAPLSSREAFSIGALNTPKHPRCMIGRSNSYVCFDVEIKSNRKNIFSI